MVLVCLPSDAHLQHLLSYLGFSYLGHGVSLHSCSSKVQPLLLTLDKGYLLTAAPPDLERGVAPLGPKFSTQILEVNKKFPHIGKHWPLKKKSRQILASGFALFPISNCLCNAGEISPILQNGCTCWIASCIFSHLLVNLIKYHRHYSPPFPIWKQSVVPCPVLTVASWPAYRFLKRQIRWSGIPISLRIFHSLLWSTQSKALA